MEETFLDRLRKEFQELVDKIDKLRSFTSSERFRELSSYHQDLLRVQFGAMMLYHNVLEMRLRDLDKPKIQDGESATN